MGKRPGEELPEGLREDCIRYFRERPVFGRLLRGFREKYASYGKFAGSVTLRNLQESEREDLEGFFSRNYHGKKSAAVSAELFEKALSESRFDGIRGREVLELYFQEPVEGKKEQRQREEQLWEALLSQAKAAAGPAALRWITQMQRGEAPEFLHFLKKRCREAGKKEKEAERLLGLGVRILDSLRTGDNAKCRYLAVFAAEMTGNPHAFDDGTKDGKYLELLIAWLLGKRAEEKDRSGAELFREREAFPALARKRLYLQAGILRDDVSNYALAAGVRAADRSGRAHAGMEGFWQAGEPVQIPLSVIAGWTSAFCPGNRMYIVENPSVYAILCGMWDRSCGLMCMNGQPRFSSLLLLDLLAQSGTEVWYAGDLDPEGLLIAQRLKRYYRGSFHYWHMSEKDYACCISGEEISPKRLKMLEHVSDPGLAAAADALRKKGRAGYQENMASVYPEIFRQGNDG